MTGDKAEPLLAEGTGEHGRPLALERWTSPHRHSTAGA